MKQVENKDRKQYFRPQLVKHGKVETLTLGRRYGSSQPV